MNGAEFTRKIRGDAASPNPQLPIVLFVDAPNPELLRTACEAGIEGIVSKSTEPEKFIKRIGDAITAPKRFVASKAYFGPCRRGETPSDFKGPNRREQPLLETRAQEAVEEIERAHTLGLEVLYVNLLAPPYDKFDPASYHAFARDSLPTIEALEAAGVKLGYHNHSHEFFRPETGGETLYELLLREFDPRIVIEPDLFWMVYAGANPAAWLPLLKGRAIEAHVKGAEIVPDERYEMVKLTYAPVGEGNIDWDTVIPAGHAAGIQTWVVEQDLCRRDHYDCIRSSLEFLKPRV